MWPPIKRAQRDWQAAFLHCAAVWLDARWRTMGNQVIGGPWKIPKHPVPFLNHLSLAGSMLGEVDYAAEMRLLVSEMRLRLGV